MNVKTLVASFVLATLFASCDPNADKQVGNSRQLTVTNSSSSSGTIGTGSSGAGTTDAPLDGGLSVLLLAGAAYGVKRVRRGTDQRANEE